MTQDKSPAKTQQDGGNILIKIEEIIDLVKVQLGAKQVKKENHIVEDLGAESADIVNIIASVEDKYHIKIDEGEIGDIQTVVHLFELVQHKLQLL